MIRFHALHDVCHSCSVLISIRRGVIRWKCPPKLLARAKSSKRN